MCPESDLSHIRIYFLHSDLCHMQFNPLQLMLAWAGEEANWIYRDSITGLCFRVQFFQSVVGNQAVKLLFFFFLNDCNKLWWTLQIFICRCNSSHMFRELKIKINTDFFYFIKVMSKFQMHKLSWNSKGKSLFPFKHIFQQIFWLQRNHLSWRNSWFFICSGMKYAIRVEKR